MSFHLTRLSVLLAFLLLAFLSARLLPFSYGSDEVAHFHFARFIADTQHLPRSSTDQDEANYKSDLPPLFYVIAGLSGRWIPFDSPPFVKITGHNPRLQLIVGLENLKAWRAFNTEDPLRGEVLLWYWFRWVTVVSSFINLLLILCLMRIALAAERWQNLAVVGLLAFTPTYLITSSVISYEPLLAVWLNGYLWMSYHLLKNPHRTLLYFGVGLLLGLACLTKYTPLPLIAVWPGFILWGYWRHRWGVGRAVSRLTLFGLGFGLTFGLWMAHTVWYFNQIDGRGWLYGLAAPFLSSDGSDTTSLRLINLLSGGQFGLAEGNGGDSLLDWGAYLFWTMWGNEWLAGIMLLFSLVVALRLILLWTQFDRPTQTWLLWLLSHLALLLTLPLLRFGMTQQAATGPGHHLLFPASGIIVLLFGYGLTAQGIAFNTVRVRWLSMWKQTALTIVSLLALTALGATGYRLHRDQATPLPLQTVPLPAETEIAHFDGVTLIQHSFTRTAESLVLTLWWRANSFLEDDYRFEVALLDQAGQPRSGWAGQPLNGRYPTRAWFPQDRLRTELHLPLLGLSAGTYQVQLSLRGQTVKLSTLSLTQSIPFRATDAVGGLPYHHWQPPNIPYNGGATISLLMPSSTTADLRLTAPDGQQYPPFVQHGQVYHFAVAADWQDGLYRLTHLDSAGDATTSAPFIPIDTEPRHFIPPPISNRLTANFANQLTLLGYDLPQRQVKAGERLVMTLHWQAQRTVGASLITFQRVVDGSGQRWGGQDRIPQGVYDTLLWAPNEIVSDSFALPIAANAPDGIYDLLVGVYLPVGAAVSLPLVQHGQLTEQTNLNLGRIKIGATLPAFLATKQPDHRLDKSFGVDEPLSLTGFDWHPCNGSADERCYRLRLMWHLHQPLTVDYTTFVHLRNAANQTVAQADQQPFKGSYPTSLWTVGETVSDDISLSLPPLPADTYHLIVGLYDWQTGQRLSVSQQPTDEIVLTSFVID